jgi:hypothetical protein
MESNKEFYNNKIKLGATSLDSFFLAGGGTYIGFNASVIQTMCVEMMVGGTERTYGDMTLYAAGTDAVLDTVLTRRQGRW